MQMHRDELRGFTRILLPAASKDISGVSCVAHVVHRTYDLP